MTKTDDDTPLAETTTRHRFGPTSQEIKEQREREEDSPEYRKMVFTFRRFREMFQGVSIDYLIMRGLDGLSVAEIYDEVQKQKLEQKSTSAAIPASASIPASAIYDKLAAILDAEQHAFRQQLAARLAPTLNARTREMPHGTYEEKKELARWVNEELRRFDLAIKCPKTGEPSMVMATPGNSPESGRFSIEHKTAEGKRVRSVNTIELPEFELMEAAPRREALREWQDRVKRGDSGASRA